MSVSGAVSRVPPLSGLGLDGGSIGLVSPLPEWQQKSFALFGCHTLWELVISESYASLLSREGTHSASHYLSGIGEQYDDNRAQEDKLCVCKAQGGG